MYRVLQVLPYFPPHAGWLEAVAEELSLNLVRFGYAEVCNLTFWGGQHEIDYVKDGYRVICIPAFDLVHSFPFPKFWSPGFWSAIGKAKEFAPDVVQTHTRFFLSTFLGGVLSKLWKKPWIHIEHGSGFVVHKNSLVAKAAYFYDRILGSWCIRNADKVVAISKACACFVEKEFARKSEVIYRGFDLKVDSWVSSENQITRIAFVGRLVSLKAVDLLLKVLSRLPDEIRFSCNIVGDGDQREEWQDLCGELRLNDRVRFLGSKSREWIARELLPNTDILVNPSLQEGLPTTVIEWLVAGCVVVATDVGGTTEISDQKDLVIVSPSNEDDLLAKLLAAIEGHAWLHGLSRGAVLERFDSGKSMQKFVRLFQGLR